MLGVFSGRLGVLIALVCAVLILHFYLKDMTQKKQAILRNYLLVGHLRCLFGQLGECFRQYFFLGDRDERPFNRSPRSGVHRMAKREAACWDSALPTTCRGPAC